MATDSDTVAAGGGFYRFSRRATRLRPSAVREILKTTESPEVISFAGGLPAPELFPAAELGAICQQVLAEEGPSALQYGVTEGYAPLRKWICGHLAEAVGLNCVPEQVLITNGAQQALDLTARMLVDSGDIVLVENPSYLGAIQAFAAHEARLVAVDADREGMCPDALQRTIASLPVRPQFIYLIPTFHNPTGVTTPLGRRRELAAIAAEAEIPLLEDDPYGRLRFEGAPVPAMASLGVGHCLYSGTFSKTLAPGLRIGWLVAPHRSLLDKLVPLKQAADLHSSSLDQRVAWRYVARPGAFQSHVEGLCRAYAQRRDAMLSALQEALPEGCAWERPEGGLFLWVRLPEGVDTMELLRAAIAHQVAFVPGAPFWIDRDVRNTLRLNFSNASEERIAEGVRRLGVLLKDAMATA